jgi:hypothetical protein
LNQNAGLDHAELEKIRDEIVTYIATLKGAPRWAVSVSVTSLDSGGNSTRVWGHCRLGASQWYPFHVELTQDRKIKSFQG